MKTALLFGITSILLYVIGIIFFDTDIELASHDTYFIINETHISSLTSVLFLLIAFLYFLFAKFSKPLNLNLGRVHYVLSIFPVLILLPFEKQLFHDGLSEFRILFFLGILFFTGQLLFLITIIWTIIVRRRY